MGKCLPTLLLQAQADIAPIGPGGYLPPTGRPLRLFSSTLDRGELAKKLLAVAGEPDEDGAIFADKGRKPRPKRQSEEAA